MLYTVIFVSLIKVTFGQQTEGGLAVMWLLREECCELGEQQIQMPCGRQPDWQFVSVTSIEAIREHD